MSTTDSVSTEIEMRSQFGSCRRLSRVRHRRLLRILVLFLLAYFVSIFVIIHVLGYWVQWLPTSRLLMAVTPSFAHNYLCMILMGVFKLGPSSRHFGVYVHQLSPVEALKESAWMRNQRTSLDGPNDCSVFSAFETSGVDLSPKEERLRTEEEVAKALDRWYDNVGASLTGGSRLETGGWFTPGDCRPRETVAIIVPYRDRFWNLMTFLNYMHRFLQHQRRRYVVVLAEQANYNVSFNRAKLFNAAVRELLQQTPQIDCFVLHDVDKVPFHLFNLYSCGFQPRQLATAVGTPENGWEPYYNGFMGAVTAFSRWQLLRMNGASNCFYGWGGEDDDMAMRAALAGFAPSVAGPVRGRMRVMSHHDDRKDGSRVYVLLTLPKVVERMDHDGLAEVRYRLMTSERRPLYTLLSFRL